MSSRRMPCGRKCSSILRGMSSTSIFDEIMSSGESVSLFTDYGDTVNELWVKTRVFSNDDWRP